MEEALDTAFMRRVRFTVEFPFPNAAERAAIWRGIFPSTTPINGLDFDRLARLDVAGGSIRNIALNAAFRAADAGEVVGMPHLFAAARGEFRKLRRQMNVSEVDARDLTRSATNTHRSN
jgi:ATP-dependent 26S proteasome regulatory subunit